MDFFFLSSKSYFCTQNSFPEISFRELSEFSSISSISVTSVRVSYILVFRLGLSWRWQMREKSSTECCFHGSAESKLTNHKEMKKISVLLGSTGAQELKAIQLISTGPPRTTHIKWAHRLCWLVDLTGLYILSLCPRTWQETFSTVGGSLLLNEYQCMLFPQRCHENRQP